MNTAWASIVPTLFAIIAGVITQYVLFYYTDRRKRNADLKMQAYVDLIRSVSELGMAQRHKDAAKEKENRIKLLDAKSRIVIYGSQEVIKNLAEFFKEGGVLTNAEERRLFIRVYQAMRNEYQKGKIEDNDVELLIFNGNL
jgi:hypothetical protein